MIQIKNSDLRTKKNPAGSVKVRPVSRAKSLKSLEINKKPANNPEINQIKIVMPRTKKNPAGSVKASPVSTDKFQKSLGKKNKKPANKPQMIHTKT